MNATKDQISGACGLGTAGLNCRLTFGQDDSGPSETHGYTEDEDGSLYYWYVDEGEFSWRQRSSDSVGYYIDTKTRQWVAENVDGW